MDKVIIKFSGSEIEKWKLCSCKNPIFLEDVDSDDVLRSNKVCSGEKQLQILYWLHG